MKLFKKLIPLASVVTAAAVVSPIATSCTTGSSTTNTVSLETLSNIQYRRKTSVKPITTVKDTEEGIDLYLDDVANNHQIMVDDFFQDAQALLQQLSGTISELHNKYFDWSGEFGFNVININKEERRVSFDMTVKLHLDVHVKQLSEIIPLELDFPADLNLAVQARNLQFAGYSAHLDDFNNLWGFIPNMLIVDLTKGNPLSNLVIDYWKITNDKKWSINLGLDLESPILEEYGILGDIGAEISGLYNSEVMKDPEIQYFLEEILSSLLGTSYSEENAAMEGILEVFFIPQYMANVEAKNNNVKL